MGTLFSCQKSSLKFHNKTEDNASSENTYFYRNQDYHAAIDIFKSLNGEEISSLYKSNNEDKANILTKDISNEIVKYAKDKYSIDMEEIFKDDYNVIVVGGLVFALMESNIAVEYNPENPDIKSLGQFEGCLYTSVLGLIGIRDINALIYDFKHGVSPTTIMRSLKLMVGRTATAITVVITVYEFGDCMNWW